MAVMAPEFFVGREGSWSRIRKKPDTPAKGTSLFLRIPPRGRLDHAHPGNDSCRVNDEAIPLTELLQDASQGDAQALGRVFEQLYPQLKRIAHARLYRQGGPGHLGTTALVHESFVRMAGGARLQLQGRAHFLGYAAKTMRHIIVDLARRQLAQCRGGDQLQVTLDTSLRDGAGSQASEWIVAVHEALADLEAIDASLARVVEMRYFAGYTDLEIAELLGSSERTVRRQWDKARAWLGVALGPH
jgi:RNA polymerase sigma factor (TIGR02999 family)